MDSQYKVLSELLSDQAVFITSPKTSLANYWGGALPPYPPVSTGLVRLSFTLLLADITKRSSLQAIAFFKEFDLVGKFFKRATKNWKILCDHALKTHIQSRLRLLHVDNFKIIVSSQKQLNL